MIDYHTQDDIGVSGWYGMWYGKSHIIFSIYQTFDHHQALTKDKPTTKSHSVVHAATNVHKMQEYWAFAMLFLCGERKDVVTKEYRELTIIYKYYTFSFSSSSVLCAKCCQCLWIVHSWLFVRFFQGLLPSTFYCNKRLYKYTYNEVTRYIWFL